MSGRGARCARLLLSLAPLLRGEGGERSEPGEGLSQITHRPLTRLGPSVLGTLSPLRRERVRTALVESAAKLSGEPNSLVP